MRTVKVSAPGKVILFGEHAVVYGKTALAVSIGIRTHLTIKEGTDLLEVHFPDLNKKYAWTLEQLAALRRSLAIECSRTAPSPASTAVISHIEQFICPHNDSIDNGTTAFIYLYLNLFTALPPLHVTLHSDIPIGAGLGSSAAMSVCFSSSLLLYSNQFGAAATGNGCSAANGDNTPQQSCDEEEVEIEEKQLVSDWAFMAEKIMHGTPSGIDNSVATFGGVLAYRAGEMQPVGDLSGLEVLLVNTRVPRNTKELVAAVRSKHNMLPKVIGPMFEAIEHISETAISSLQAAAAPSTTAADCQQHYDMLESLIDINQGLLVGLGVSHPALGRVVDTAAANGIHAKLTGAGGGGFALGLVTPATPRHQVEKTRRELEELGFICYETRIAGDGVKAWLT